LPPEVMVNDGDVEISIGLNTSSCFISVGATVAKFIAFK